MLRLQPDVTVVAEIERMDDVLPTLDQTPCDVLLLDLQMDRNAFVDIAVLAARAAVVVVTATERVEDALAAVRAGARGLVFKRFAIETLMTATRTVAEGQVWLPPEIQTELSTQLRESDEPAALTQREREVVRHVALGLRNAEVAERARHHRGHREDAHEQRLPEARDPRPGRGHAVRDSYRDRRRERGPPRHDRSPKLTAARRLPTPCLLCGQ